MEMDQINHQKSLLQMNNYFFLSLFGLAQAPRQEQDEDSKFSSDHPIHPGEGWGGVVIRQ
jgi:hypothetical protein